MKCGVAILSVFAVSACSAVPLPKGGAVAPEAATLEVLILEDHPLVDTIVSTRDSEQLSFEDLLVAVENKLFVLLGEKHDNRSHHELQGRLIDRLSAAERRPAVVYEMLDRTQDGLEEFLAPGSRDDLTSLPAALRLRERGWPPFEVYGPAFTVPYSSGAPMLPGSLGREELRNAYSEGLEGLENGADFGLLVPLNQNLLADLWREIARAHCGRGGEEMLDKMAAAQQVKDAFMAQQLSVAAGSGPRVSVLVAGAGHVRQDRGVPFHLRESRRIAPEHIVSIAFREVERDKLSVEAYELDGDVFDYVVFTPRVDEVDPCIRFEEQLRAIEAQKRERSSTDASP